VASWAVAPEGERVRVTRDLGGGATTSWLVEVVRGRAILVELVVTRPPPTSDDGLDSKILREAIKHREVIEEARSVLQGEQDATLMAALRAAWDDDPTDRDREIVLTAVAYVAMAKKNRRKVVVRVADAIGIPERRVRHNVELARDRGLIARSTRQPRRGHFRGVPDGELTDLAFDALTPLIARRLGVPPDRPLFTSVRFEDGTEAALLGLLRQPPVPREQESGGVIVDGSGARAVPFDTAFTETRIAEDGSPIKVLRR
jgi:hypothetical protein